MPNADQRKSVAEANNWILTNFDALIPKMHQFIAYLRSLELEIKAGGVSAAFPERLDETLRLPDEMPICGFWDEWHKTRPIPAGFRIVNGSVLRKDRDFLDNSYQARRGDHRYLEAIDGSDVILDHCVGLFFKKSDTTIPKGGRLAVIIDRAGDLVKTFTNGEGESHTFLIGARPEIEARLGLRYDTLPRYES